MALLQFRTIQSMFGVTDKVDLNPDPSAIVIPNPKS